MGQRFYDLDYQTSTVPPRTGFDLASLSDPDYLTESYLNGYISGDELFDSYLGDLSDLPDVDDSPMSESEKWIDKAIGDQSLSSDFLSRDELHELSTLVKAGCEAQAKLDSKNTDVQIESLDRAVLIGKEAKNIIFSSHLRLATWFARESMGIHRYNDSPSARSHYGGAYLYEYASLPLSYSERLQSSLEGIWSTIDKYDPDKGSMLTTLAMYYMERNMLRRMKGSSEGYVSHIPEHTQQLFNHIRRNYDEAQSDEGRLPNISDVAYELGQPHDKLIRLADQMARMANLSLEYVSETLERSQLDDYTGEVEDVLTLADRVRSASDYTAFSDMEDDSLADSVLEFVLGEPDGRYNRLDDRCRTILELHFGLNEHADSISLDQIGREIGVTRERTRQIESRTLSMIRNQLVMEDLWDEILDSISIQTDVLSGMPEGVLMVSPDELDGLNLEDVIRFEQGLADKYALEFRLKTLKRIRHQYEPDW